MSEENAVAVPEDMAQFDPELAKQLGLKSSFEGSVNTLPRLSINKDFDDDAGNTLPPGTFYLKRYVEDEEGNSQVDEYFSAKGEPVQLRVFANMYQVIHYDKDLPNGKGGKGVHVNKTILVPDMGSYEMLDELGGTRCGKIKAKDRDGRTSQELQEDKKKQTYRFVYGKVKMDKAVDRKGNEKSLDWTPCFLKLRGSNFMPIGEVLDSIDAQGKMAYNIVLDLTLKRHKNDDVIYYVIEFDPDMENHVKPSKEDGELLVKFMETINAENAAVRQKHDKALKNQPTDEESDLVNDLDSDLDDDLDDGNGNDLDDEIPF